jgi:hypothetical protein
MLPMAVIASPASFKIPCISLTCNGRRRVAVAVAGWPPQKLFKMELRMMEQNSSIHKSWFF